ncbi:DUF1275 domain-containing protein [Microbacteriaceae bacterium VKM Ac-2855]|nr:DUF1275 domain-containing protein [Microbacteriaceae bacterium VKM Ac-2855]
MRRNQTGVHLGLMLALTFSTGIIDAVGYLGLDRVFTGNMTGNVVILGMALAGADDLPIIGPILALAGFMLGAAIGGRVLRPVKVGWTHRSTILFTIVGVVMAALAIVLAVVPEHPEPLALSVTATLGLVMGLQAATARHLAVKDVTTVVVTSTITGLAADSRLGGGHGQPWFRRLAAVILIGAGAGVGALALNVSLALGLGIAAFITVVAALIGHVTGHVKHTPAKAEAEAAAA